MGMRRGCERKKYHKADNPCLTPYGNLFTCIVSIFNDKARLTATGFLISPPRSPITIRSRNPNPGMGLLPPPVKYAPSRHHTKKVPEKSDKWQKRPIEHPCALTHGKPLPEASRRPKKELAHFQGLYTAWKEGMILK
jgi:hypothetical protein